jgi:putative serine protease PepD
MRCMNRTLAAGALATVALAGGAVGAATSLAFDDGSRTTTVVRESAADASRIPAAATSGDSSVNAVYEGAASGVVEIKATGSGNGSQPAPFDGGRQAQALGSGFVYDEEGHVITNQHVVEGASSVEVKFADGSSHEARVVGADPSTDIAVLEVDAPENVLEPLALGSSDALEVGDGVVAIGSPFGLTETVTSGIVSALDRRITSPNGYAITGAVQTDAAINHGNSGGPLLNMAGEVVGVNAQIESESGGSDGVGFAIPSNTVRSVVAQILENGAVEHAYLGVSLADSEDGGARVAEVRPGSPAERAGLQAGDVITAVDGAEVTGSADLQATIDAQRPGDTVSITYTRSGESGTLDVELGTRPDS